MFGIADDSAKTDLHMNGNTTTHVRSGTCF